MFTNGQGVPTKEGKWHLWRLNRDAGGWSHIYQLDSTDPGYLTTVLNKFWFQDFILDRYGARTFMRIQREEEEDLRDEEKALKKEWFDATQAENAWLTRAAMDNFSRGVTKASKPQKQTIMSYAGQVNRGTQTRDLEDEDVLVIPGK